MGGVISDIGDFFQDEVIDPIADVGRDIDSFIRDEIPGGWLGAAALAGGAYYGLPSFGAGGLGTTEAAFLGADAAQLAAQGLSEAQIAQTLGAAGVDSFIAADAAQLAAQGLSSSQISSILGQQTLAPVSGALSPSLSIKDALQGARLAQGLMGQPQMAGQMQSPGSYSPQGAVDYSGLYSLLGAKPQTPSLLGTRFQPENSSIAEYLKAEKIKNLLG